MASDEWRKQLNHSAVGRLPGNLPWRRQSARGSKFNVQRQGWGCGR